MFKKMSFFVITYFFIRWYNVLHPLSGNRRPILNFLSRLIPKRTVNGFVFSSIYYILMLVCLETVFHISRFGNMSVVFPILFAIPIGLLLALITDLFSEKTAGIIRCTVTVLLILLFGTQIVYHHTFKDFMSMSQVGMGGDVFKNFLTSVLIAVWECLPWILLLLIPLVLLLISQAKLKPKTRFSKKKSAVLAVCFICTQLIAVLCLPIGGTSAHSAHGLYHDRWVMSLGVEKLGLLTSTVTDIKNLVSSDIGTDKPNLPVQVTIPGLTDTPPAIPPSSEGSESVGGDEPDPESPYNIIEGLDFAALAENESDATVKAVMEYLATLEPTKKNEYTGMFEGYNLIMLTAESFSPMAVDKELTPTLYKLVNSGFVFENFWNMYPSNTTNGEYSVLTGLAPDFEKPKVDGSFVYTAKNSIQILSAAAYFNGAGVTSRAYHNYTKTYYDRNLTHTNLGFVFKGREDIGGLSGYPTSDLVMMQRTLGEYINDDRFFAYYMTFSGHHNYIFENHTQASKNKYLVDHLELSEGPKAYIACHIELDRALEYLINELDKAGKLANTVICLAPDHYPYGLTDRQYKELLGHGIKYDGMERYVSNLVIWNSEMETVKVSKPCCQVDVLPTLLNLFGFEYDSRLYTGNDILSDTYGLVMTSNESFVTDKIVYNSIYGTTHKLDKKFDIPDGYIDAYLQIMKNRYSIAATVLNKNFYARLPHEVINAALKGN